jgi:hypothetical protein
VVAPSIVLNPETSLLVQGESVVLTARPQGGEAMLFTVDWQVREGDSGGTVQTIPTRRADGGFGATYTAPRSGAGRFHVIARIHEYPSASAVAEIAVAPRH